MRLSATASTALAFLPLVALSRCRPHAAPAAAPDAAARSETSGVTFLEDDYARARAEARAKGLPLFVDAWAPWCHTCLSMRAYVFPDARLRSIADRFVWLSIDTERESNAEVVGRLGVRARTRKAEPPSASRRPTVRPHACRQERRSPMTFQPTTTRRRGSPRRTSR
jgi:thiol-disulfide isomerase/thioredoxin